MNITALICKHYTPIKFAPVSISHANHIRKARFMAICRCKAANFRPGSLHDVGIYICCSLLRGNNISDSWDKMHFLMQMKMLFPACFKKLVIIRPLLSFCFALHYYFAL